VPQLISIIKTKNTAFINIPMYAIYLIGCLCFLLGGFLMLFNGDDIVARLSSGLPLVIAQSICGTISSIIFINKLKNYFAAKRAKITELQYCHQLKKISDEYKQKVASLSKPVEETITTKEGE
jgi:uncharacterized protein with PQ loop repeat